MRKKNSYGVYERFTDSSWRLYQKKYAPIEDDRTEEEKEEDRKQAFS